MAYLSETIWFAMQGLLNILIALSFLNCKVHFLKHSLVSETAMKNTFLKLNLPTKIFLTAQFHCFTAVVLLLNRCKLCFSASCVKII